MKSPIKIHLTPMVWRSYESPKGFLSSDMACHALFFYASCAAGAYKDEKENIRYTIDGKGDQTSFNYFQMWKSAAEVYGVSPDSMAAYWPAVNLQLMALGLTVLPDEPKYRSPGSQYAAVRYARPQ